MKLRYFPPLLLASLVLLCCNHTMGEEEYAEANLKVAKKFEAYTQTLQDSALPIDSTMTRDQRRAAMAESTKATGDRFEIFAKELQDLKPPQRLQAWHRESLALYVLMADQWHRWGEAIAKGDRKESVRIEKEMDEAPYAQQAKVLAEIKKVLPDDPRYHAAVERLELQAARREDHSSDLQEGRVLDKGSYVDHWIRICYDYCTVSRNLKRGPDRGPSDTAESFRAAMIAQVRQDADKLEMLGKREAAVVPPKEFEAMHQATIKLFNVQYPLWRKFADALETNNQTVGEKALAEIGVFIPKQIAALRQAAKSTPGRAAREQDIDAMAKWNPMSPPTDAPRKPTSER